MMAPAPAPPATTAPAPAPIPFSAPASTALTLEEELQEAIRRAQVRERRPRVSVRISLESQVHTASACPQLLPNRGIDDILEDQVEPEGKSRTLSFGLRFWASGSEGGTGWCLNSWVLRRSGLDT